MNKKGPIEIDFKSAQGNAGPKGTGGYTLRNFDSYSFNRSILTPAAPFRFTAPGVDASLRMAIRSGDTATLWAVASDGTRKQLATGFIDETDTHITPNRIEYVLSGRDTMSQLVDNSAVDSKNSVVPAATGTLDTILGLLIQNTRIPQGFKKPGIPNTPLLFHLNAGETKINALQRYLEFTNCLIWSQPNGQLVIGKPNFAQPSSGSLWLDYTKGGNILDCRVRRSPNTAIRQIVTQAQTLALVNPSPYTIYNQDTDVKAIAGSGGGRSVYTLFSYGQGEDAVNQVTQVGNQSGNINALGAAYAKRELARDNVKVLEVECVVRDHVNEKGVAYNIDQMYLVQIPDEDIYEDMYVYDVEYELTIDHGMLTRLKLCRKGTLCADTAAIGGSG